MESIGCKHITITKYSDLVIYLECKDTAVDFTCTSEQIQLRIFSKQLVLGVESNDDKNTVARDMGVKVEFSAEGICTSELSEEIEDHSDPVTSTVKTCGEGEDQSSDVDTSTSYACEDLLPPEDGMCKNETREENDDHISPVDTGTSELSEREDHISPIDTGTETCVEKGDHRSLVNTCKDIREGNEDGTSPVDVWRKAREENETPQNQVDNAGTKTCMGNQREGDQKPYTRAGGLKQLMLAHTGEKPYKCMLCEKQFTLPGQLKVHMTVHTGDKPHKCTLCDKQYTRPQANIKPSNDNILHLLELVLTKNNFQFNGEHFLQIQGASMGSKCSPSFAITHLDKFERQHVYTYHHQPLMWVRYIDDVFCIFKGLKRNLWTS